MVLTISGPRQVSSAAQVSAVDNVGGQDVRDGLALKRIHGMRSLYHGFQGMRRWVGLSVIAADVIP